MQVTEHPGTLLQTAADTVTKLFLLDPRILFEYFFISFVQVFFFFCFHFFIIRAPKLQNDDFQMAPVTFFEIITIIY